MRWDEVDSLVPRRYPAQSLMAPSSLVLPTKSRKNDAIAHTEVHDGVKYDKKSMAQDKTTGTMIALMSPKVTDE